MNNPIKALVVLGLFLLSGSSLLAQTGRGGMTVENSTVVIAEGSTEMRFSEGSYFGPEADWLIDGTLELWSRNIWIATEAKFRGKGKIILHNPGDNPFFKSTRNSPTYIDGNNSQFINLLIEHRNNRSVVLKDIDDPGYGTLNPSGAQAAQLNIGKEINLARNGAHIVLNGNDLVFNASGELRNADANRMVVTGNSITGSMVKEFGQTELFLFPVGISEGDYTPATIQPYGKAKISVSVQDYIAAGIPGIIREEGMDRMWHIYADKPTRIEMTLQHNKHTNGSIYRDEDAAISQYLGNSEWDFVEGVNPSEGVHVRYDVDLFTALQESGVWFTKYSPELDPFFIPNIFTPNGDGVNDLFEIMGAEKVDNMDLVVFNRWGTKVYENNQYQNNWSGEGLNEGTYYYLLSIKTNGKTKVRKGWVFLKR